MTIAFRMLKSAIAGILVFGALIFGPAGTVAYWRGWAFILVFAICTNIIGLYLARTNPALLERRMKVGPGAEPRPAQKAITGPYALVRHPMYVGVLIMLVGVPLALGS